eukprot:3647486-Amphidinium_carterae.3
MSESATPMSSDFSSHPRVIGKELPLSLLRARHKCDARGTGSAFAPLVSLSFLLKQLPRSSSRRPRISVQLVEGGTAQCGAKVSNLRSGARRLCHQKQRALSEARKFAAVLSLGIPSVSCL